MNKADITLGIAIWGAVWGTISAIVGWCVYRSDRARLQVSAAMSWTEYDQGPTDTPYMLDVTVTNAGRRIARLNRISLQLCPLWLARLKWFLLRHRLTKRPPEDERVIYHCMNRMDDPDATARMSSPHHFPTVDLVEHEPATFSIRLTKDLANAIPIRRPRVVVTDSLGRKHSAGFGLMSTFVDERMKANNGLELIANTRESSG